ncbi:MAG: hypothetical protein QF489_04770 [Planctomycetota bacterium]|jgi:hypothetical protein|nr:hypothetical protein [Planctomycetota bacterium]
MKTRFLLPAVLVSSSVVAFFGHGLQASPAAAHALTTPDVIVGDIYDHMRHGTAGGESAYSFGSVSCNIGNDVLNWISWTNEHPVIASNIYRLKDGRFEQLGLNWLKHGFTALNGTLCGSCQNTNGNSLGIGCSDPYSAYLNGFRSYLGPRSEVNAYNGYFPYPPILDPSYSGDLARRIIVDNDDINPSLNSGARYFIEIQYMTGDDNAEIGNGSNNVSWREIAFSGSSAPYNVNFVGATVREESAIMAWQTIDPNVTISEVQMPGDGSVFVASRATVKPGGGYNYDYTVYNRDCDRSVRAFIVPLTGNESLSNKDFTDVDYHSGEPYVNTDWRSFEGLYPGRTQKIQAWYGGTYNANQNNNAIRWSSSYSMHFESDTSAVMGQVALVPFKPGTGRLFYANAVVPQ